MQWAQLLFVIGALLLAFLLYQQIKKNPQVFSRENLSKSFGTMAVLTLLLIAFIAFLVFLLRR